MGRLVELLKGSLLRPGHPPDPVEFYVDRPEVIIETFADGDTSPSVASTSTRVFKTANTAPTIITTFDDGRVGQVIDIIFGDANTTLDFDGSGGGNLKSGNGVDWTPAVNDQMKAIYDGTNWYCIGTGQITGDYLRADTADTAAGQITFEVDPYIFGAFPNGVALRLDETTDAEVSIRFGHLTDDQYFGLDADSDFAMGITPSLGSKFWHSNNVGPGSGLDADTVDGIQGSNIMIFAGATVPDLADLGNYTEVFPSTNDLVYYNGTGYGHTGITTIVNQVTQAEAEAGTATTNRLWTAQRVKQAIDALAPGGGGALNDLSDVTITSATTGEYLRRGASAWVDSSLFISDDTSPQLGGHLDTNFFDIQFKDSDQAIFGTPAGGDAKIYSDGTDLYIDAVSGVDIRIRTNVNENAIICTTNGSVDLYYDNVSQILTQSYSATGQTSGASVRAHDGAYKDVGFNTLDIETEDVSDTLEAKHCGGVYFKDGTTPITLTCEGSGTTDFPVGGVCTIINAGTSGDITVADNSTTLYLIDGTGRTDVGASCTVGPGGVATLWREAAGIYYIWGQGITA